MAAAMCPAPANAGVTAARIIGGIALGGTAGFLLGKYVPGWSGKPVGKVVGLVVGGVTGSLLGYQYDQNKKAVGVPCVPAGTGAINPQLAPRR
jgi:hypothetical protein